MLLPSTYVEKKYTDKEIGKSFFFYMTYDSSYGSNKYSTRSGHVV